MGYSTDFTGSLKFKSEISNKNLANLNMYLGEDRRDIGHGLDSVYENGKYGNYWYHIDLVLEGDYSGIRWNDQEKTCELEHIVNWLTDIMRVECPDFELEGELIAQGEDPDDKWILSMVNGLAVKIMTPKIGDEVTCPHCCKDFKL